MANQQNNDPLLRRLYQHLQELGQSPQKAIDEDLLALAAYDLPNRPTNVFTPSEAQNLIIQIYQLLPAIQQSPAQLVRLLSKLLEPVPLSAILSLQPPVDFVAGLDLAAKDYHTLTLSLLGKADDDSAQRLATNHRAAFESLVILWLCSEDAGVADTAGKTLLHLLTVGKDLVWKRMFRDKDVYEQLFAICYPESDQPVSLSKTRKTIAQARLLEWVPKVGALDWNTILQSHHPDVEQCYGLKAGEGLLDFSAMRMVDYRGDVLMHRSLILFFASLLSSQPERSPTSKSYPALEFLQSRGLHARTMNIYINPDDPAHDPVDITFLYSEAANYSAAFASTHPKYFLSSDATDMRNQLLARLSIALSLSPSSWSAPARSPAADLHVLSSLPRSCLLPDPRTPLHLIPSGSPNSDALKTLATIFHGPLDHSSKEITFPTRSNSSPVDPALQDEIALAHTLYSSYISHNQNFYADIMTHANRPSIPDVSIAALTLLRAVITAQWDGVAAVMAPGARNSVIPFLMGLPNAGTTTVGSAGRDLQRIAEARFGVAKALAEGLIGREEWRDVQVSLARRVSEGVWGIRIGGSIATMGGGA